jgi:Serine acetyltransferase, N-terminal
VTPFILACRINIKVAANISTSLLSYLTGQVSGITYVTGLPPLNSSTMKLSISITLSIILCHCQSSTSYYLNPSQTRIFRKQSSTHVIPPDAMYGEVGEDNVWNSMRIDAQLEASKEPLLASFMHATILSHSSLERALAFHIANLLSSPAMISTQIQALILEVSI